jgi:hypothetical protein
MVFFRLKIYQGRSTLLCLYGPWPYPKKISFKFLFETGHHQLICVVVKIKNLQSQVRSIAFIHPGNDIKYSTTSETG